MTSFASGSSLRANNLSPHRRPPCSKGNRRSPAHAGITAGDQGLAIRQPPAAAVGFFAMVRPRPRPGSEPRPFLVLFLKWRRFWIVRRSRRDPGSLSAILIFRRLRQRRWCYRREERQTPTRRQIYGETKNLHRPFQCFSWISYALCDKRQASIFLPLAPPLRFVHGCPGPGFGGLLLGSRASHIPFQSRGPGASVCCYSWLCFLVACLYWVKQIVLWHFPSSREPSDLPNALAMQKMTTAPKMPPPKSK